MSERSQEVGRVPLTQAPIKHTLHLSSPWATRYITYEDSSQGNQETSSPAGATNGMPSNGYASTSQYNNASSQQMQLSLQDSSFSLTSQDGQEGDAPQEEGQNKQNTLDYKKMMRKMKILKLFYHSEPTENDKIIHLHLRSDNGYQVTRAFKSTDHLSLLHAFIYSNDAFPDKFHVYNNRTRFRICCSPMGDFMSPNPTFGETRLTDFSVLLVKEEKNAMFEDGDDGYKFLDDDISM